MSDSEIEWSAEAKKRLKKAPFFVRKMAKSKVEKAAQKQGITTITPEFMEKIKNKEMGK